MVGANSPWGETGIIPTSPVTLPTELHMNDVPRSTINTNGETEN